MKKIYFILSFVAILGFAACKKDSSKPLPSPHLKVEVDLNGLTPLNIDSAFVIATKDQQTKKLTLTVSGSKAVAESEEIKAGTWNLEIQFYTKKDNKKLFYKLVKESVSPAGTAYQYKCPTLPTSNMKTVPLDGWDLFYMYYYPKATIVLPYFSDNPKSEIWVKSTSDWDYVYADRGYYNSPTPTENYPVENVATERYDPLTFQNKILTLSYSGLPSRLLNKTWNKVDCMVIVSNSNTGEEILLYHEWK